MTLHRYHRTLAAVFALALAAGIAAAATPGEDVYTSLLHLWDQAPEKFSGIVGEDEWNQLSLGNPYIKGKYQTHDIAYDIPEFEEEEARLVKLRENEPADYVISAKKFFSSDAACEEYYQSLLARIPVLLAKDGVKIKRYDDHVFYKDRTKNYYRKLYVKRYLSDKREKQRVIVSVRVEFPENK